MSRMKRRRLRLRMLTAACMAAAVAVTGAITVPAGAMASPPILAQAPATSTDEKYAAAAVLGWVPREEVTLTDRDFVTVLWEKASEKHNREVKVAALAAFSDATDAEAASTLFIQVGIFEANDRDVALKARKAELDTIRLRAAQEINWVPANNTERATMLDQTLQNYVQELWRRAATWPEVKAAAEPLTAADATDDERLDFLQHGLFDKAETDRQNEIANGNAEVLAARAAAALRSAKEKAIAVALKRSATSYELDDLEEREFIYLLASDSTGRRVKADATVAYANPERDAWLSFIFSGVHLANKVDLDERDLAEARANEVKVRDIMYAAEADGYQPSVVAAAKKALEGVALDRSLFLLGGADTARQADYVRPSANRTVMIQAVGYNGCIAAPIAWMTIWDTAPAKSRVDPCNENHVGQRWSLVPDSTGRYKLTNGSTSKCLFPASAQIQQDGAPIMSFWCEDAENAVWELLDGGQGNVEIRNVTNNKVMTVVAGSGAGALNLVQNPTAHTAAQQWRLIDVSHQGAASKPPVGSFRIKGAQSGRCLRPVGALTTPGAGALAAWAKMELRDCGAGTEQIWDVVALSDTRFELRNRASQFCLTSRSNSVDVIGWAYTLQTACGGLDTPWTVMFNSSSGVYLRSAATGNYAGARDSATANGTLVDSLEYAAAPNYQWILEPVSDNAVAPAQVWRSPGKPLTSFTGAAVAFQQQCSATTVNLNIRSNPNTTWAMWRSDTANTTIKHLIRGDLAMGIPSSNPQARFQFCVVAAPTSSKMEVTMKSTASNAYVREATNVTPAGSLVADTTSAASAEHFLLQQRDSKVQPNSGMFTLQSVKTKKYAVLDTSATGAVAKAIRFNSATPTAATEMANFYAFTPS
jgi:hypothetical protein